MSQFSEEIAVKATPNQIFTLYEDVANWNQWDPDVASSSIAGPFTAGTSGKLKPTKGPEAKIEILSVEVESELTQVCADTLLILGG